MVAAVRRGASQRKVASRLGAALSTVQFWVCRAEVDLDANQLLVVTLRRREPTDQLLLKELLSALPRKHFKE